MAKKIDAALAKQLKNIGITAKTEDDAREKLLKALEKEGIEGMEEESTDTLIEMVESFKLTDDSEPEEEETEEEGDDDAEANELADEVEAEDVEDEELEEDDDTEEEVEEEEETPAPAPKKAEKKAAAAPKKAETPKKEAKKAAPAKKETAAKAKKRGNKLDPRNVEADREPLQPIIDMFGDEYDVDWLTSNGGTIKHAGKNGKRGVVSIENLTRQEDGEVTCNLYLLTMKNETNVLEEKGIEYQLCWTKAPMMKCITLTEVKEILEQVFENITGAVKKIDKRLGENRKKMEESLQKSDKKAATKKATPAPVDTDDEVEDDEEETPAPKKEAKKAALAKKAAKKTAKK